MDKVEKQVTRGTHFLIPKEHAEILQQQTELYLQHANQIMYRLISYYQQILTTNPDVKIGTKGILFKNTKDDFVTGMDGKKYELAANTNYKKGKQVWWTPSQINSKSQDISKVLGKTKLEIFSDRGKKLKDTQIKDMLRSIFPDLCGSYIFDVMDYCSNRITSRKRNTTKKKSFNDIILETVRPPLLRNLTIHSKRKRFKIDHTNQQLLYKDHRDNIISVPYEFHTSLHNVINPDGLFDRDIGGNFKVDLKEKHDRHKFTVQCEKLQIFDYMPENWISFDANVARKHALTFYDLRNQRAYIWERSDYAQQMIDDRASITRQIDDNNKGSCNAKVRSRLRKKRDIIDIRQKRYCRKIFIPLLNKLKRDKAGLAIDDVSWGASSGNNAMQESIGEILPDLCYEVGVPYYLVNPSFTSRECSECGYRHTEKQKNKMKETFVCKSCGWTLPMHQDAARTIAMRAQDGHDLKCHYAEMVELADT